MYYNDLDLQVAARYKIDELRRRAETSCQTERAPRVRIALAHALIAVAYQIWHEEGPATEPAVPNAVLT